MIMGRGKKDSYDRIIQREGISERVSFIGEQSSPEEIYRQAHHARPSDIL